MVQETNITKETKPSVFREVYSIDEPYVYAAVIREPNTQKMLYKVVEPTLLEEEERQLEDIKSIMMEEIDVNFKDLETREKAEEYLKNKVREVIGNYHLKVAEEAIDKFMYYIARDFIGYGKIDPFMKDHLIEDISADGVNIPIYVWHREHESLPTNIVYEDVDELNSFIVRLAYLAKRNVSIASPMLDASLPDGSRIQLTYGSEVTRRGSTFTIRRFRADPLTISDLIAFNTLSSDIAAYLWYAIENRASILVAGGVAAGKTTVLNCLSMFIKPELKIVSVEDTAELNLPRENWIPSVVRSGLSSTQKGAGTITLFDLLKTAVRQRPDYIIVGEVRGEEAYTLFQAMATGHLGMSTVHAESVDAVIHRLESEPMSIPRALLSMIDVVMIQLRTEVNGKPTRRTLTVTEVVSLDPKSKEFLTNDVYRWDSKHDTFSYSGRSHILQRNIGERGVNPKEIQQELRRRKTVLEWMVKSKIHRCNDVAAIIREYSTNPVNTYRKARMDAH
ncbi:MAG: type II/IV secretion system ATPase subunit [Candidatus Bathyarchaeota archaeon]|nr:MAG: type II/IV secretion system ATPase subunit [Candidatus Bathyarchaeota archaeon]